MQMAQVLTMWRAKLKIKPNSPQIASVFAYNDWYAGYAIAIPGIAGSWLSFLYFGAAIWAIISVAMGRYSISIPKAAMPFAMSCMLFFALMVFSSSLNSGFEGMLIAFEKNAALLCAPLLIGRFGLISPSRYVARLYEYAAVGAIITAFYALFQIYVGEGVAVGGAGNPSVFGFVMTILAVLSLANFASISGPQKILSAVGFAASVVCIFLSHTRTLYPLAVLLPVIFLYFHPRALINVRLGLIALVGLFLLGVGGLYAPKVYVEFVVAKSDVELSDQGRMDTSLGLRKALWTASAAAIKEQPLVGYGMLNKMKVVRSHLPGNLQYLGFSHVHNAFLDATVASGLFGFAGILLLFGTPMMMAFGRQRTEGAGDYRFAVTGIVACAALNSTTNLLFTHDLMTIIYLLPLIIFAAAS